MDEVFGHHPKRPQHPDFWELMEIILGNDAAAEEDNDMIRARLGRAVDLNSVHYIARQRALLTNKVAKERHWPLPRALNAAWLDGFLAGHQLGVQHPPAAAKTPKPRQEPEDLR